MFVFFVSSICHICTYIIRFTAPGHMSGYLQSSCTHSRQHSEDLCEDNEADSKIQPKWNKYAKNEEKRRAKIRRLTLNNTLDHNFRTQVCTFRVSVCVCVQMCVVWRLESMPLVVLWGVEISERKTHAISIHITFGARGISVLNMVCGVVCEADVRMEYMCERVFYVSAFYCKLLSSE